MQMLTQAMGSDRDYLLTIYDDSGNVVTTFQQSDTPQAAIWSGQQYVTLASPTVVWTSTSQGQLTLTIAATDIAPLSLGIYRIQVWINHSGRHFDVLDAQLELTEAPGAAATPRAVYCQRSDMIKWAPWLEQLQVPGDLAGFADQRADARDWLDNLILLNYRGATLGMFGFHSQAAFEWGFSGPRRTLIPSYWLRQQLDANKLMVRATTLRICAHYAISEVCIGLIGKADNYASLGARFRQSAISEAISYTAEIDLNGDGLAEIGIPLVSTNSLFT